MKHSVLYTSSHFLPGAPPVVVLNANHHGTSQLHSHEFFEMVLVDSGFALHSSEGDTAILTTGDLFIIQPGESHAYVRANHAQIYNCLFIPEAFAAVSAEIAALPGLSWLLDSNTPHPFERVHTSLAEKQEVIMALERIKWEAVNRNIGWQLKILTQFQSLLVTYARIYSHIEPDEQEIGANIRPVYAVLNHIESNYSTDLSLDSLAAVSGLSAGHLTRQFKAVIGMSPVEYARSFRIAKAAELLRVKGSSVSEVSRTLGFADISLFSRQFKLITGTSPTEFRKG